MLTRRSWLGWTKCITVIVLLNCTHFQTIHRSNLVLLTPKCRMRWRLVHNLFCLSNPDSKRQHSYESAIPNSLSDPTDTTMTSASVTLPLPPVPLLLNPSPTILCTPWPSESVNACPHMISHPPTRHSRCNASRNREFCAHEHAHSLGVAPQHQSNGKAPPPRTLDKLWTAQEKERVSQSVSRHEWRRTLMRRSRMSTWSVALKSRRPWSSALQLIPNGRYNKSTPSSSCSPPISGKEPLSFISEGSDINSLQDKAFAAGTCRYYETRQVRLASCLSVLTTYQNNWVFPPAQTAWFLLALHQLCFQDVAIALSSICGYPGVTSHTIIQAVHTDLGHNFLIGPSQKSSCRVFESMSILTDIILLILDRTWSSSSRISALAPSTTSPHRQFQDDPEVTDRDRSYPAVLATSVLFRQMFSGKGLGTYCGVGGASKSDQEMIIHNLIRDWTAEPTFIDML